MIWSLVFLSIASRSSHAGGGRPLYASYCSALLENQQATDLHQRESITRTLDTFRERAEERLQANRDFVDQLPALSDESTYVNVWLENETDRGMTQQNSLGLLRRVPERVAQLQRDIYSIQHDVVAGAMEIRGRTKVLAYLDGLHASVERNEAELRPRFEQAHPYVTKKRLVGHAALIAVPTAAAGATAWWTIPSLLALDPSLPQMLTLAASVPVGYASFFAYWMGGAYWRGVLLEKHRAEYEDIFGHQSKIDRYDRFVRLRKLVGDASSKPEALVHVIDRRAFTESELRELKAAAEAKRAPSLDFAEAHELSFSQMISRDFDHEAMPISYEMSTDLIYFFDRDDRVPVLVVSDRVRRKTPLPMKRRRDPKSSAQQQLLGGLSPAAS